jgi:hypothetical protein
LQVWPSLVVMQVSCITTSATNDWFESGVSVAPHVGLWLVGLFQPANAVLEALDFHLVFRSDARAIS